MVATWATQSGPAAASAEALRLVDIDPRAANDLASDALAQATRAGDWAAASVAERARGRVALLLSDLDSAVASLRQAVAHGRRAHEPQLVAEARMSLAYALNWRGEPTLALTVIGKALLDLTGVEHARGVVQRAAILQQLGRLDDALAEMHRALPVLRAASDTAWVQRTLSNRAVLRIYRYQFTEALADLGEAERLCREAGLGLALAIVHENTGFAHSRRGDVPSALHHFAEAEERYRAAGAQVGSLLVDRSELLLSVRLVREAREAAEQAVAEFVRAGRRIALPEGLLLAASAALLDGDHERALAAARQAERAFRRQCRTEWLAFARFVILRCRLASGSGARVSIVALTRVADALDGVGWTTGAADARVQAARLALDRGQPGVASALLHQAGSPRSRGPAELRIRAWHAEALLRVATGRRQAAAEAIRAGLRVVEEYRDTLGSTDLRAHVSAHGGELAELGVRLALTHGSTHDVLEWTERARSTQLLLGRVRPPADEVLATRLAELRAATDAVRAAVLSGEPVAALRRRQSALETAVRDEHRRQHGESTTRIEPPTVASLSTRLGDTVLIEYIDVDGRLEVIIVDSHGARRRSLASTEEVARVVTHLPLALHRAARGGLGLASALTLLDGLGARLDRLLIEPIRAELGERPLTVVPTGVLQSLPWALLPSLAGRPVTVCPSATLWHRASARPVTAAPVLAVAGPGLPKAREEVAAIGEIWPGARTLVDGAATVAEVLAGLGTAGLVHIAAHGRFRIDNPLFSSLQFADGLITVYDLQLLPRVPDVVILAACEAGRSRVCAGDELLGLAAAFLTMGTSTLIASTVAVPDAEVATLMVALHRRLAAGESPAAALASAQRELISTAGPATALVAATSFVCLGASTPVITATPAARRAQ